MLAEELEVSMKELEYITTRLSHMLEHSGKDVLDRIIGKVVEATKKGEGRLGKELGTCLRHR